MLSVEQTCLTPTANKKISKLINCAKFLRPKRIRLNESATKESKYTHK